MSAWPDLDADALLDTLTQYYNKVGANKSRDQLILIAEKFKGKEEMLFERLEKQYSVPVRPDAAKVTAPPPSINLASQPQVEPNLAVVSLPGSIRSESEGSLSQPEICPLAATSKLAPPATSSSVASNTSTTDTPKSLTSPTTRSSQESLLAPTTNRSSNSLLTPATEESIDHCVSDASALFKDMRAHSEQMKSEIKKSISHSPRISTFDLYNEHGPWQKIAKHQLFENVTLGVIVANAFWMGVETDWNKAETLPEAAAVFQIMEHSFCTYFSVELFIRYMAFKHKCDTSHDPWFVFDSILMVMMVSEDWILLIVAAATNSPAKFPLGDASVLRLLRLLRLMRLARMLKSMPELLVLIKAMLQAITSVGYVLLMLVGVTYVIGIACTQLSIDTQIGQIYFQNVALSMYSLMVYACFLDNLADFMNAIRGESIPVLIVVFIFITLACLTLMNMLLGVLCDVISDVASSERTAIKFDNVAAKLRSIGKDLCLPNRVTPEGFWRIMQSPEAALAFADVSVDVESVVDLAEQFFFHEDGTFTDLSFEMFLQQVFELRYENPATLKDIKFLHKNIMPCLDRLLKTVAEIKEQFLRIEQQSITALAELQQIVADAG